MRHRHVRKKRPRGAFLFIAVGWIRNRLRRRLGHRLRMLGHCHRMHRYRQDRRNRHHPNHLPSNQEVRTWARVEEEAVRVVVVLAEAVRAEVVVEEMDPQARRVAQLPPQQEVQRVVVRTDPLAEPKDLPGAVPQPLVVQRVVVLPPLGALREVALPPLGVAVRRHKLLVRRYSPACGSSRHRTRSALEEQVPNVDLPSSPQPYPADSENRLA